MTSSQSVADQPRRPGFQASWFDLSFVVALVVVGFFYLDDPKRWASWVYVGNDQWGDADFWWQGALQLAQGIFWNNAAITFRMGYAIFAGLSVAVIGPHYVVFHHVLTLVFLGLAATAYLALRGRVGRPVAIAMAAVVVFTPAHAEFVAISTSDGLGLGLNIAALVSLILAARARSSLFFVLLAGLFLSLAGLTRPLMSLFIAPSAFVILVATEGRFVRKAVSVAVLLVAFATPTLCWMSVLYAKTGVFALAGYDSSIFYAASTPKIQVWTPEMYPAVQAAAEKRFGAPPTTKQLNDEFWTETIQNYRQEWRYHLHRLGPNILKFADFDHFNPYTTDAVTLWMRWILRGVLGLFLVGAAVAGRRWVSAILVAVATGLSLWPPAVSWVVVAAAAYLLLAPRGPAAKPVAKIVSLYWLTGVAAIFLIGGISKFTPTDPFRMNALGDRLGTQCFFSDDWLILLGLGCLAGVATVPFRIERMAFLGSRSSPRALLKGAGALSVLSLLIFLSTGAVIAGWRSYKLATADRMPFPPAKPVIDDLCRAAGAGPSDMAQPDAASATTLRTMWGEADPAGRPSQTRIFTGSIGALLWRMGDQGRTRALFNTQTNVAPFMVGDRADVEVDAPLVEDAWRDRQGLYVIRSFPEEGSHKGLWRESLPEIQTFVPALGRRALLRSGQDAALPAGALRVDADAADDDHGREPRMVGLPDRRSPALVRHPATGGSPAPTQGRHRPRSGRHGRPPVPVVRVQGRARPGACAAGAERQGSRVGCRSGRPRDRAAGARHSEPRRAWTIARRGGRGRLAR